ncbi:MAG: hypothetical protein ACRYFU_08780 [Janthinobacterium lividum]
MSIRLEVVEIEFQPKPTSINFERPSDPKDGNYAIKFAIVSDDKSSSEQLLNLEYTSLVVKLPRTMSLDEAVKQARERVALLADQLALAARS